jgi:hypothetical protein
MPIAAAAVPGAGRTGWSGTTHTDDVQIRIEASDLPGRSCGPSRDSPGGCHNIHAGVQRRNRRDELLGLVPGDMPSAIWVLDCTAAVTPADADLKGPCIQWSARAAPDGPRL